MGTSFLRSPFPCHQATVSVNKQKLPFSSRISLRIPKTQKMKTVSLSSSSYKSIRSIFTGIVEEMGKVTEIGPTEEGFEMTIQASIALEGLKLGDSIAVNGTCLTVTRFNSSSFSVGLAPETLRKTSLGEVSAGSRVNLERSMQPISRMGGHFVQGHVDGTGTIVSMVKEQDSLWVKVKTSPDILKYVVPKGYIAVDGTSLTVVNVFDDEAAFNFMLVAYTQQHIVVPTKSIGSKVNLEVDIVGKYVARLLAVKYL
mgnify:CR=1 FL=1